MLKYKGGGDWYNDVNSLKNLAAFCNVNLGTNFDTEHAVVEPGSPDIFNYPFVYMTGHGNFTLDNEEAANLRSYLVSGGFLLINDDFGIDPYARLAMKKVFPELDFVELPFSHPIYHQKYEFPNGLPKIHEHENMTPRGFGIFYEGRLVCFYDFECDLGDGWDDVHNDPEPLRQKALQMGANIIQYVFLSQRNEGHLILVGSALAATTHYLGCIFAVKFQLIELSLVTTRLPNLSCDLLSISIGIGIGTLLALFAASQQK